MLVPFHYFRCSRVKMSIRPKTRKFPVAVDTFQPWLHSFVVHSP